MICNCFFDGFSREDVTMARTVNRDLTQGSPMKLLIGFALPLLGGFLFQQL